MTRGQLERTKEIYKDWGTSELVQAIRLESSDFEDEALELMKQELHDRGITKEEEAWFERRLYETINVARAKETGLRGSLLVFVVFHALTSVSFALSGLYLLTLGVRQPASLESVAGGLLSICLSCYGFFTLNLLIRKRTTAPRHAFGIWSSLLFLTILSPVVNWDGTESFVGMLESLLQQSLWPAVWLLWIETSPRVKNTYLS